MESKRIAGLDPGELKRLAASRCDEFHRLAQSLKKNKPPQLDAAIRREHDRQFASIDCLDCANCCKSAPALLRQSDMDRLARRLGLTTGKFIDRYVLMDEDGDFVLNAVPCPFLLPDNRCSVYDDRPESCADYPHTARKRQAGLMDIHLENAAICPAVFRILETIGREFSTQ